MYILAKQHYAMHWNESYPSTNFTGTARSKLVPHRTFSTSSPG